MYALIMQYNYTVMLLLQLLNWPMLPNWRIKSN